MTKPSHDLRDWSLFAGAALVPAIVERLKFPAPSKEISVTYPLTFTPE